MKTIYILIMCIICGINVFAQKSSNINLGKSVSDYYEKLPQEKIYVHTDRTAYIPGDTIWLRAYVVDAATNQLADRSKFIYVELIDNAADTVVSRMKIKEMPAYAFDSLSKDQTIIFANALALPRNLNSGEYTLAAYTQWMRNFGKEGFYRKKVQILKGEGRGDKGAFLDKTSRPSTKSPLPSPLSLNLFPEGGNLIAGCHQRLAYKAIGVDGLGVDVKVKLVDENGKVLQEGVSQHLGMGELLVFVSATDNLFLEATAADGRSAKTPLQKALPQGASLHVKQHNGQLLIQPIASADFDLSPLSVIIYGAGNLLQADNLSLTSPFKVAMKDLKSGIINIALVNPQTKQVWAERLFFVR